MRFTALADYDVALTAAYKRGSSHCDCALRERWLGLLRLLRLLSRLGDADNIGNIKLARATRAAQPTRASLIILVAEDADGEDAGYCGRKLSTIHL